LYNVPGRTVTDIHNDTTLELAGEPNIVGIKDATGDLHRGRDLITRRPDGFMVYSGDDGTAAELVLSGADGDISVTANVAPAQMAQLMNACLAGNRVAAEQIDQSLRGLHSVLFQEPNPIPAKWVLSELGLMRPDCRLPLVPVSEALKPLLRQACVDAGVRL
jgi:4-hydroxy-tetrahydrodipicolinate synthase